tara:strand:+ start:6223 stop:7317 length:1095 start_codon:yes stop_codon:yes gene_type:complete
MASILTSAQPPGMNSSELRSKKRLDLESAKADKTLFNKTYSKNIDPDSRVHKSLDEIDSSARAEHPELERLADETVFSGKSMPPIGRQLPKPNDEFGQAPRQSNGQNALTDAKSPRGTEGLQAKMSFSAGQFFQSLSPTTPAQMSVDALGVSSGNIPSVLEGGVASLLLNSHGAVDIDLKESVLNINARLIPSIDLRSNTVSHNGLQASVTLAASSMSMPINHPQWGTQFQQRMSWLVGQKISRVEIHLNPLELGPLQVRIDQRQDSTVVSIVSQNATTRELLESNASRLKELFSDQGLELLDVEVNDGDENAPSTDPYSSAERILTDGITDEDLSVESDFMTDKGAANISGIVLRYGRVDTFV